MGAPKKIDAVNVHFCPTCDTRAKAVKMYPGGTIQMKCENGHYHAKKLCVKREEFPSNESSIKSVR